MPASDKNFQTDQELHGHHFHMVSRGAQLLVLRHSHAWHPPTDVMAEEDRLIVIVEVAGMMESDFRVSLANQVLTITGHRLSTEQAHVAYYQLEVRFGEFRTDVNLPWPVTEDEIIARYEDGFLRVELPRAKPRQIRVVDVQKVDSE
jgi:HSP20 family protein